MGFCPRWGWLGERPEFWMMRAPPAWMIGRRLDADDTTADPQAAPNAGQAEQGAGPAGLPAEGGGLSARLHHAAEEAELGAAQSGARASHQSARSDQLHSGRGP